LSDLYIHFSMCNHKYKVMIKDWSILHALTFWMHVHQATPLQRHLHSIHFQWSTHVLAHLASSRATMLANAFSTPTNITEFGHISSCCICWNNSIAFHLCLHSHVPISWQSKLPHFEMVSCWTLFKQPVKAATFCIHVHQAAPQQRHQTHNEFEWYVPWTSVPVSKSS